MSQIDSLAIAFQRKEMYTTFLHRKTEEDQLLFNAASGFRGLGMGTYIHGKVLPDSPCLIWHLHLPSFNLSTLSIIS